MPIDKLEGKKERYFRKLSHTEEPKLDPIAFEIIRNRLESVSNEMGVTVHKTAFNLSFSESKDFSCALLDYEGHLVALGEFIPGHQGTMQNIMDNMVREVGLENMGEGDIFMANDTFYGAAHTPDLALYGPIHYEHELVAIGCCVLHHVDMGGMAPTSYCPQATEIYQEGIRFPPTTKLYESGELRKDILNIFLTNIRLPEEQYGNLKAQVSALHIAKRRVLELVKRWGVDMFKNAQIGIQVYSERAVRNVIKSSFKKGKFEAEDLLEGDGHSEKNFRIRCALGVKDDRLIFDYTGSDEQARGFVNAPLFYTGANVHSATLCYIPLDIPKNYGATVPIEVIGEKGTIVNCERTAPIGACTTEIGYTVHNVANLCLAQANPKMGTGVWGGGFLLDWIYGTYPDTGKKFISHMGDGIGVGGGARATMDGWSPSTMKSPNEVLPNIELTEDEYPVIFRYRRLSTDENYGYGGPGMFRGGPGLDFEYEAVGVTIMHTMLIPKYRFPAQGVFGGMNGGPALFRLKAAKTGQIKRSLRSKEFEVEQKPGESLHITLLGGGGYGEPFNRDPELVLKDVRNQFVSISNAARIYGVMIKDDFSINREGTERLRRPVVSQT